MTSSLDSPSYKSVALVLGPFMVGTSIDLLLQGVLSCQFVNYYSWYSDDKWQLHAAVGFLALSTWLKSIQAFAVIWIKFIEYYGNFVGAFELSVSRGSWWDSGNALMGSAIGLYVQSYFLWRLYVVSKNVWISAALGVLCVFSFLAAANITRILNSGDVFATSHSLAAHVAAAFVADLAITLFTCYFLLRTRQDVLPHTAGLISALVRLTFQTAAPATICALIYLILSQVTVASGAPPFGATLMDAFNTPLPKLYAISMMWTLNARRSIHAASNGMTATSTDLRVSGMRYTRGAVQTDLELGRIQVLTQTERSTHVDVRDMFDPTQKHVAYATNLNLDVAGADSDLDAKMVDEQTLDVVEVPKTKTHQSDDDSTNY
ncbi:hypothetical protein HMN09_00461800 [Mycena chlorophos]|uniref:DUF6534 domain-containing protein n=1 Tax=Mycena chlorophos TaxID=658473 RepID=A0A8H6WHR0_MYCCL|nr:hypothetical protein HMN09_00461800 [Mycena chlorophos]